MPKPQENTAGHATARGPEPGPNSNATKAQMLTRHQRLNYMSINANATPPGSKLAPSHLTKLNYI